MACSRGCCGSPAEHFRSLRVIDKRTRPRITEGKDVDTGQRWKATTDELNNTVTERSQRGPSGVSERQDVYLRPGTVRAKFGATGE